VATTKRQRKKENQAARRAALEAARRRQRQKRQLLNVGALLGGVLLLALILVVVAGRGGKGGSTPPTTSPQNTLASVPPVSGGRKVKGETPCPKPKGEERASSFEKPPPMCIDPTKSYRAVFKTEAGVVKAELDTKMTPLTANNFVVLARYGYYDGSSFHRTEPGIDIIQGGSPATQSSSDPGPGYKLKDEGSGFTYAEGDLVMARTQGPDSGSSQYFFAAGPNTASLGSQGTYVKFGKVVEGIDVLKEVLASHVACPEPASDPGCSGGAPQPPVKVDAITIEEA